MIGTRKRDMRRVAATLLAAFLVSHVAAQEDPNAAFYNEVIVVPLEGRSIAALITHKPGATKFTHAIALFPGHPGTPNPRIEDGRVKIDNNLGGNTLIRARRHFLGDDLLTVVVDAPSDYQKNFPHSFRASPRYGEDINAVVAAISKRFGPTDWTYIGHSEGTISAAHAARMAPPSVKRVVLMSSLTKPSEQGVGVQLADVKKISMPILWVHHQHDPCKYTPYWQVKNYAAETQSPLLTVTGEEGVRGDPCGARTQHGFVGTEIKTIKAIVSWIRTGKVPPDVSR